MKPIIEKKIFLCLSNDKNNVEKAVLPAIIFINTNHKTFREYKHRGFLLAIGWWHYSIKIGIFI